MIASPRGGSCRLCARGARRHAPLIRGCWSATQASAGVLVALAAPHCQGHLERACLNLPMCYLCRCFGAPARRVFPDHLIT